MGLISYVDGPEIPPKDKKTENPLVIRKYNGIKIPKCKDDTKTFKNHVDSDNIHLDKPL